MTCRWVRQRPDQGWDVSEGITIDARPQVKVEQMLVSEEHSRLLIAAEGDNTLWSLSESSGKGTPLAQIQATKGQRWVPHSGSEVIILIEQQQAQLYSWADLTHISSISLKGIDPPLISRLVCWQHHRYFATLTEDLQGPTSNQRPAIHIWDSNDFAWTPVSRSTTALNAEPVKPLVDLGTITIRIFQVIGIIGDYFVFLDKDFWVCSVDLSLSRASLPRKHSASAAPSGFVSGPANVSWQGSFHGRRGSTGRQGRATTLPVEAMQVHEKKSSRSLLRLDRSG